MGDRIFSEEISDQLEKIFFYDILEKKEPGKPSGPGAQSADMLQTTFFTSGILG